ncbi:MAG TPA: class I SAM-dependent methyltransferase [Dehalococcoidia bacterium]
MTGDPLAPIARFYDLDFGGFDEDLALYRELARRTGGPVLELGVGTGRVALPLARAGLEVTGIDASPAFLAVARERAAREGATRLRLVEADARTFRLDRRFRLVISALGSFAHLETRADQLAALARVREHLAPDGLVVDLPVLDPAAWEPGVRPVVHEWTRRDPATGRWVDKFSSVEADPAVQTQRVTYWYDERDEAGTVRRTSASFPLRHVFRYEMEGLLSQSGLALEAVYGDYDLAPFEAGSRRLIVVAGAAGGEGP